MEKFKLMSELKRQANKFITQIDEVCEHLKPYNSVADLASLQSVVDKARAKENEIFEENRKLKIAVMGEVKSGKSSFLNTLLFKGAAILPQGVTPKTAVLTKIEYAPNNAIELHYYDEEEWKTLEELANQEEETASNQVAKEILGFAQNREIDVAAYCKKKTETIYFESYDAMMGQLENYVGEEGFYTPITKYVVLQLNEEKLKDICIVDTPGLSDPVISRTAATKAFLEECDVVFFLSKTSQFLTHSDLDLLVHQLPQKGVNRLLLVGSRYDDGIVDTLFDAESLKAADKEVKKRLTWHAERTFNEVLNGEGEHMPKVWQPILEACKKPYFVSSIAYALSEKDEKDYNELEAHVLSQLSIHEPVTKEFLKAICGIDEMYQALDEVIRQKEELVKEKAGTVITDAILAFKNELVNLQEVTKRHNYFLRHQDEESLLKEQNYIIRQVHSMAASVEEIFGQVGRVLEQNKVERLRELREASKSYVVVREQTGVETGHGVHTVSQSKWYNPSSWGTSKEQAYDYEKKYSYIGPSDVLENIRNFAVDAATALEDTFYQSVDLTTIKNDMLTVIVEHFDTSEENYDPMYFKLLAERAISKIELPVIRINVKEVLDKISTQFTGEIRSAAQKADLRQVLVSSIDQIFETLTEKYMQELKDFKAKMLETKNSFLEDLEKNVTGDLNQLIEQIKNKETQIQRGEDFIHEVDIVLSKFEN